MIKNLPVTDYQVAQGTTVTLLATAVKALFDSGWTLAGDAYHDGAAHNQPMAMLGPQSSTQN